MLLRTGAFRLGHFQAEKLLHGRGRKYSFWEGSNFVRFPSNIAFTFTHKNACRKMLLPACALRPKYIFLEMMLQTGTFRRSRVYTQVPLHRDAFSHRRFNLQYFFTMLLLSIQSFTFCRQSMSKPKNALAQQHTGAEFSASHGFRRIFDMPSVNWMLFCGFVKIKAASGLVVATC